MKGMGAEAGGNFNLILPICQVWVKNYYRPTGVYNNHILFLSKMEILTDGLFLSLSLDYLLLIQYTSFEIILRVEKEPSTPPPN